MLPCCFDIGAAGVGAKVGVALTVNDDHECACAIDAVEQLFTPNTTPEPVCKHAA